MTIWIVSIALAIVAAGCWWQVRKNMSEFTRAIRDQGEWQRRDDAWLR